MQELHGCFCKIGVLFVDVLLLRALVFGVYVRAPQFFGNSLMSLDRPPDKVAGLRNYEVVRRIWEPIWRVHAA